MGALHAGHLALVEVAAERSDVVVVSIFVNPLQFNRGDDFDEYPRPIDDDVEACRARRRRRGVRADGGRDVPRRASRPTSSRARWPTSLEGASRPGHFRGVATVVAKLFGAVQPDVAVFGEKDFQQLADHPPDGDRPRHGHRDRRSCRRFASPTGWRCRAAISGSAPTSAERGLSLPMRFASSPTPLAGGQHDASRLLAIARERIAAEPLAKLDYVDIVDPGDALIPSPW